MAFNSTDSISNKLWAFLVIAALLTALATVSGCGGTKSRTKHRPSRLGKVKEPPPPPAAHPSSEEENRQAALPSVDALPEAPVLGGAATSTDKPHPESAAIRPPVYDLSRIPFTFNRQDQSEMVLIPEGSFWVTAEVEDRVSHFDTQSRLVRAGLAGFYMDRYEITVAQFKQFLPEYDDTKMTGGPACPQCPAMGITWRQAAAYCAWAGKRLPEEAEWEAAARGGRNRPYPWGDVFEARRANLAGDADGHAAAAPVGSFPLGASDYGVMDLTGNVWEWVGTPPAVTVPATQASAPESEATGTVSEPTAPVLGLVKGGSYRSPPKMAVLSARNRVPADMQNPTFGFRCVKSLP